MGDRANIRLVEGSGQVYFYSHWGGTELPGILASALDRGRNRWGDAPYLNRIIFSEMIKKDVSGETGYGISCERGDYNHEDLVVDHDNATVTDGRGDTLSFDNFIELYG